MTGRVRLQPNAEGYVPHDDLEELAEELRQGGFDATAEAPPRVKASAPWDVVRIFLDPIAAAAAGAVAAKFIAWAKKRWKRSVDDPFGRDHLGVIYGPDGEVLKRVYIEGEIVEEITTDEGQRTAMERALKRERKRMGLPTD